MKVPGIVTCDLALNKPRYPNIRDTMLAMRKPQEII